MNPPPGNAKKRPAIIAQALFLTNLLLLPGIAFLALLWHWLQYRNDSHPLTRCHVRQAFSTSVAAGALLLAVPALILLAGKLSTNAWVFALVYFVTAHGTIVLLGAYGLARAISGKHIHLPLLHPGCERKIS